MTEFETILMMLMIPIYGILFYVAGRLDLFERLAKWADKQMREYIDSNTKGD